MGSLRLTAGLVALAAVAAGSGCAAPPGAAAPDAGSPPPVVTPLRPRCTPAGGVSRSPSTIAQVVDLVNALPRPLSLTCFLESLDRPLQVAASSGVISLQPARGTRSPRLFLRSGALVSTIVPEGSGSPLVEFGEFVDAQNTIKGEIAFPIEDPLDPADPYLRIRQATGTVCRGCHRAEHRAEGIAFAEAYVSAALRPVPSSLVPLERVRHEHRTCDPAAEPERCAFLDALFEHGEVVPWEFPAELPTIFY